MKTADKFICALFLGISVGIITMLGINQKLWPIGLIIGFFGGYMSYEYKTVLQAIPVAWHRATNWQPDREWWQEYQKALLSAASLGNLVAFLFVINAIICCYLLLRGHVEPLAVWLWLGATVTFLFGFPALIGLCICADSSKEDLKNFNKNHPLFPTVTRFYFYLLPVWFAKGVWWLVKQLPEVVMFARVLSVAVGLFVWHLFKLIHSEERLLCGIDAALGVAVCHYSGNNILFGLAFGVIWGVLNFEILSIRVLKLVPAEASILYRIR